MTGEAVAAPAAPAAPQPVAPAAAPDASVAGAAPAPAAPATAPAAAPAATPAAPAAAPAAAPEYSFKAPEGMEFAPEAVSQLTEFAKANNLQPEAAQKIADMGAALITQAMETQAAAWRQQQETWIADAKKDPEIGGANFAANQQLIDKALATVGTPALADVLKQTGMANNPEIARLLLRVGKAISEDAFRFGGAPAKSLPPEQVMFPTMFTKQ